MQARTAESCGSTGRLPQGTYQLRVRSDSSLAFPTFHLQQSSRWGWLGSQSVLREQVGLGAQWQ